MLYYNDPKFIENFFWKRCFFFVCLFLLLVFSFVQFCFVFVFVFDFCLFVCFFQIFAEIESMRAKNGLFDRNFETVVHLKVYTYRV